MNQKQAKDRSHFVCHTNKLLLGCQSYPPMRSTAL